MVAKTGKKKICVIRTGRLADVISASAALLTIEKEFPDSEITFVVDRRYQDTILNSPIVDRIISHAYWRDSIPVISQLQLNSILFAGRFDLIVDLDFSSQSRTASFLAFPKKRTPVLGKFAKLPVLVRDYELLKRIGIKEPLLSMQSWISDKDRKFASEFYSHALISGDDFLIGMNAGDSPNSKSWPAAYFADLGNYFATVYNARSIVFGEPENRKKALEIYKQMDRKPMLAAGRTDFMQSSALVERCNLFITGETPLLQIARGFSIPTIAIFGSTSTGHHTSPVPDFMRVLRSDACNPPCDSYNCKYKTWECLWATRPETVVSEACKMLDLDDPALQSQFEFSLQDI